MSWRYFTGCLLAAGCLLGAAACANAPAQAGPPAAPAAPGQSLFVSDAPCAKVSEALRRKLRQTPGLGLESETRLAGGVRFTLPWRQGAALRWQPSLLVTCFPADPNTSRVSAEVVAQRQGPGGNWTRSEDTKALAQKILQEIGPLP